jgi:hypothetical protein
VVERQENKVSASKFAKIRLATNHIVGCGGAIILVAHFQMHRKHGHGERIKLSPLKEI